MDIVKQLLDLGADKAGVLPVQKLVFKPALVDLCKSNACGNYGRCWVCPPLVGEVEDLIQKALQYREAALFQKIYTLEDSFDFEGMQEGRKAFQELINKVRDRLNGTDTLLLGAGGCGICPSCAAADGAPCRYPDRAVASLEAYGIQVSDTAQKAGMRYINGQNTVTYFGAVLYR